MSDPGDSTANDFLNIMVFFVAVMAVILIGTLIYTGFSTPPMEEVSVCTQTSETEQVCREEWRELPE
jgi:hypothetical protein